MANLKSTKKQIRKTARENAHNKVIRSAMRTQLKKFFQAITNNDLEKAKVELAKANSALDKIGRKNILHRNNVARKKSQLQQKLNALIAGKTIKTIPIVSSTTPPEAKK